MCAVTALHQYENVVILFLNHDGLISVLGPHDRRGETSSVNCANL
jgi:hypothetical protein